MALNIDDSSCFHDGRSPAASGKIDAAAIG